MLKDKLNVLMILHEDVLCSCGGMGVHVAEICKRMKKDINITILGIDTGSKEGGLYRVNDKIEMVDQENFRVKENEYRVIKVFNTIDFLSFSGDKYDLLLFEMFINNALVFLKNEQYDIIHVHDTALWRVAKILSQYYNAKIVTTCHLSFRLQKNIYFDEAYRFRWQTEASAYVDSDRLITVSNYYRALLEEEFYLKELRRDKIEVIYNGIDTKPFQLDYENDYRNYYPTDKPIVGFVGRLVPSKGLWQIIKAIKKLKNYYFILIAGISPTLEQIDPIGKEFHKMKKKYKNFLWYNDLPNKDKINVMNVVDIPIVPSLQEPFGIVALEWMALKKRPIVSNTGGLKEFCDKDNSVLIDPENLINEIKKYKDWSIDQSVTESLTWEKCVEKTKKIYREVVA